MAPGTSRPLSTASQVHPGYLPALHKSGRVEKKLIIATVAAVGIGYGLTKYKEVQAEQQQRDFEDAERRRAEAMMDAYGDRSSLEALQAAVREYDTQKKG